MKPIVMGLLLLMMGAAIGLPLAIKFPDDSVFAWVGVAAILVFGILAAHVFRTKESA